MTERTADTTILQMAVDARHSAELAARQLLNQVDGLAGGGPSAAVTPASSPWDDLSSSRTARYGLLFCVFS